MSSTPELSILDVVPVLPVVAVDSAADAVSIARALVAGGLPAIELTLRTPVALDAIRAISAEVPEILVGAGTIVRPGQATLAESAGAKFLVSPGTTGSLLHAMQDTGLPFLPGTATVSEVLAALEAGITELKFFPAEAAGGCRVPEVGRRTGPDRALLPDRRHHRRLGAGVPRAPERRLRRRILDHPCRRRRRR